jgi:RNA polymerase sigma factor (sigma-70 family)
MAPWVGAPAMEVSALRYQGGIGLHGRSPLLRLQSDERLIALVRRGNASAFEVLVSRYSARLLAFCRHLLNSREDAEDVLQEVFTAAYNAMVADERPINVRPWLYRIARNRCLNHLRRAQAVGVDSMDVHFSDFGASTADKVHRAEEFRMLVGDIHELPETQRTALVLREMDALSYDQIAEAMETTVPSVKSLLVRARLSLAEASEARMLSCEQVRIELAEVAEGLLGKASPPVRRHLRSCRRCASFQTELKRTTRALAALLPLGPLALIKQLAFAHIGHSAGAGASSGASSAGAASTSAAVGSGAVVVGGTAGAGSLVPLGLGAIATKTAAGLAAAALVTAGAVEVSHTSPRRRSRPPTAPSSLSARNSAVAVIATAPALIGRMAEIDAQHSAAVSASAHRLTHRHAAAAPAKAADAASSATTDKTKSPDAKAGASTATTTDKAKKDPAKSTKATLHPATTAKPAPAAAPPATSSTDATAPNNQLAPSSSSSPSDSQSGYSTSTTGGSGQPATTSSTAPSSPGPSGGSSDPSSSSSSTDGGSGSPSGSSDGGSVQPAPDSSGAPAANGNAAPVPMAPGALVTPPAGV